MFSKTKIKIKSFLKIKIIWYHQIRKMIIMDSRNVPGRYYRLVRILVLGPVFGPRFVAPVCGPDFGNEHRSEKTFKKSLKVGQVRIFRPNWHDFGPDLMNVWKNRTKIVIFIFLHFWKFGPKIRTTYWTVPIRPSMII